MLTEERKAYILDALSHQEFVKSTELAQLLNTSISTIRRDLQELAEANLLKRVHGGAKKMVTLSEEFSMHGTSFKNVHEKQLIAQYAASLIQDNTTIFLDAGTSTYEIIPFLKHKSITVITNAITHASALTELGIPTFILGGQIKAQTQAIINTTALQQLARFRFDQAFIGVNAIDNELGYMTTDIEEADIKHQAISQSSQAFILADHTKFQQVTFVKFADISEATIIADTIPRTCQTLLNQHTTLKEVIQ